MNNYFCTNSGCSPCQQPQPPCPPQPPCQQQPPQEPRRANCPCAEDFRQLLRLLCGQQLRALVDFSTFAFLTDYYVLGTALETATVTTAPGDNLSAPAGTYVCGSDSCETLTVSGQLYPPQAAGTALEATITQVALCRLKAVAFDAATTTDVDAAANFQTVSQTLSQLLRTGRPQECGSMIDALTSAAAVRTSTVAVGPLVVTNSAILGQLGDVLVMANSTDNRFYLICANEIDYMG